MSTTRGLDHPSSRRCHPEKIQATDRLAKDQRLEHWQGPYVLTWSKESVGPGCLGTIEKDQNPGWRSTDSPRCPRQWHALPIRRASYLRKQTGHSPGSRRRQTWKPKFAHDCPEKESSERVH